ncbi:MAG: CHASE2 domain-containing protein [Roseofilum sp. SID3]|uniref:CHASE2 domain-containing protein n=2 Tax=unclassified Roseofilum TaxID=2620099 RepID=UPI001B2482AD|nr:CHASE2 domain-containing protein [Roseofilum sp. SID3]MBP0014985.1 CHASE2 domain-containing protein [Roseofilum sp. SID3]
MSYPSFIPAFWNRLIRRFFNQHRVIFTASGITLALLTLRFLGLLQAIELLAFDAFVRLRPALPKDDRIIIIGINEPDLQNLGWPVPDSTLATLLETIAQSQPQAIGLDLYRDLPVNPGHEELKQVMQQLPNLVGIERVADKKAPNIPAPPVLNPTTQVGFNNVLLDIDGKVRRGLLYVHTERVHKSFALQLALKYLDQFGIEETASSVNPKYLQLGEAVFYPFKSYDGAYVNAEASGYPFLADFRGPRDTFTTVSMSEVLNGEVDPQLFRDRLVLIGLTAISLKDFVPIPYSNPDPVPGVEAQANLISFILDLATGEQTAIRTLPDPIEGLWIFAWSGLGSILAWKLRRPFQLTLSSGVTLGTLCLTSYVLFLARWWFPFIPPLFGFVGSSLMILIHFAHQEGELKRSTEFLQGIINTIPDPIFVKDQNHRWIVLNQAYAQLVGYPLQVLMDKSDYDLFAPEEAEQFWKQDESLFVTQESTQQEEGFTDAGGIHRVIETKRSLHRDAGGNSFLVGVIRDITQQKEREAELERLAEDLKRHNAELKLSEDQMRHIANHDVLTGLANRKLFEERLQEALVYAQANEKMLATFFLDLDGFKNINDTFGHDMGDLVIKEVAKRLKSCLRGSDTVARLGGDEFTVLLPQIPSRSVAIRVAEKIILAVTQPLTLKGADLKITLSLGISLYPQDGKSLEVLIKSADQAMYQAKIQGKNQYFLASSHQSNP